MFKLALLSTAAIAGILGISGSLQNGNVKSLPKDTRVIVEFNNNVKSANAINSIRNFVTDDFHIRDTFSHVLNAVSLDINSTYVDALEQLDFVSHATVDKFHVTSFDSGSRYSALGGGEGKEHSESDNASRETMEMPEGTKEGEGVAIAILDTGAFLGHNTFTALDEGVKVRYTKEDIGKFIKDPQFRGKVTPGEVVTADDYYWNNKVPFFFDYGGQVKSDEDIPVPDHEVYNTVEEHGNHVASLAAGNDPAYKGIAPKAQVLVMKVFTDNLTNRSTGAYDENIVAALEDCALMGVDVVNLSLGTDLDDFNDRGPAYRAFKKLKNQGAFVNISAGNAGKKLYDRSGATANWTTGMTETGILGSLTGCPDVMSIASGIPTFKFYETALIVGSSVVSYEDQITDYQTADGEVKYKPNRYLTDITEGGTKTHFSWVRVPGWGEIDDFKKESVAGKIAIVDRGETSFLSKIQNAESQGAIACAVINNDPTETDFTFRMDLSGTTPKIPVVSILYRDRNLFTSSKSGDKTATPEKGELDLVNNKFADCPDASTISSFSSDGPTYNYDLKPEITSPGDEVKGATYINKTEGSAKEKAVKDQYEFYSGTSMAAPNFCGAEAVALSEHLDENGYRETLNARMMSTAIPMVSDKGLQNPPFASPRQQGAGMVNLGRALDSKVWLEGIGTGDEGTGKAKICLFNTSDIASGKLNLSFFAHNENEGAVSFKATTYIYRPDLVELDSENYPQFAGVKFQSINDALIDTVSTTVTLNPGKNKVTLPTYTLSSEVKSTIDQYFVNGCPIEGFVILTPNDNSQPEISIPYLGFYGDYGKEAPVEPFDFEKDPNTTYPSELVNYLTNNVLALPKGNFSSMIAVGEVDNFSTFSVESCLLNENNFYNLKGFRPLGANPITGEVDPNKLYLGNNGASNCMIIQQFVTRSVSDNKITLTNTDTGEVVLIDHMFDSLWGAEDDGPHPLFKTHPAVDYVNAGIVAHRAYSIIPMYNFVKETGEITSLFPDGHYEMKMEYQLTSGGTYSKTYNLVLDSKAPDYKGLEEIKSDGKDYYRVRLQDNEIIAASGNGVSYDVKSDEKGFYFDVPTSECADKLVVNATDYAGGVSKAYIDLSTKEFFAVQHDAMAMNVNMNLTTTVLEDGSIVFAFNPIQKKKTIDLSDALFTINIYGDKTKDDIALFECDASGNGSKAIDFTFEDGVIQFKTSSKAVRLTVAGGNKPIPKPGDGPNWGLIGGLIGGGVALVAVGAVVTVIIIKKKKVSE